MYKRTTWNRCVGFEDSESMWVELGDPGIEVKMDPEELGEDKVHHTNFDDLH